MKYVLFDLDGTLLPMDQDYFTECYFKKLSAYMRSFGYDSELLKQAMWKGISAMKNNCGKEKNETVFWNAMYEVYGNLSIEERLVFDGFYNIEFNKIQSEVGFTEKAAQAVQLLKERNVKMILASNPIFPKKAQEARMRWAGVNPDDFIYITSYENSSYCKPKKEYYNEIIKNVSANPADCLMIGNDTTDDPPAIQTGMNFYLITDCLINKNNLNVASFPHGTAIDLLNYLKETF